MLMRDDSSIEKKQRAEEELEDLQRFVDARVLQSADLEAQTEELDFTDNDVGVDVAKAIGQGLQTSHTLVRLYLSGNGIGDKGCEAICLALHGNRVLADLDISHNGITNTGAQKIGSALQANRSVIRFNIASNDIGPIGAKALGIGIAANSTVQYFNASQNVIGPEGTKPLARALRENKTITVLCLEGKTFFPRSGALDGRVKDLGAIEIGGALAVNRSIVNIYLGKNGIQDRGCAAIFEACVKNPKIEEVHLNDNELSTIGALGLCEFLSVCRTLTVLDISSNELGNEGVEALAPALGKNTTLIELNLSYNRIGDAGAKALGEFLDRNGTLRILKLAGNMIDDRGIHFIAQALQSNDAAVQKQLINMWKNEVCRMRIKYWLAFSLLASFAVLTAIFVQLLHLPTSHRRVIVHPMRTLWCYPRRKIAHALTTLSLAPRFCIEQVGYLKQWKNRNHLHRAPGDPTSVDIDGDGIPEIRTDSSALISLEQLSATLKKLDLSSRSGSERKAAVPRTMRKNARAKNNNTNQNRNNDSDSDTESSDTTGGGGGGRRGAAKGGGGLGPDRLRDTVIKYLDLTENVFSTEGARAIGMALQRNNILEELKLNGNQLTDIGAESVVEALKVPSIISMTSHPLRCTPCPRAGVDERRDVISCFRHLVTRSPFLFRFVRAGKQHAGAPAPGGVRGG
jgi:Ran GTPase-activating protein (RanGAP) involved in mRNA processing and transport